MLDSRYYSKMRESTRFDFTFYIYIYILCLCTCTIAQSNQTPTKPIQKPV
ncbi:hypothetical protein HFN_1422 [Helicobacter fennelliae MRY12-0050]|uniref:Uncharacterized protein n=1 Tax=Helicobacter fennelliae MRY12-0050 TaxID=1325130 RepID=T1DX31_9HELI|nr:hypothetical protein HFN_1422 [Helicobacter fennelliae MRY12-0050]